MHEIVDLYRMTEIKTRFSEAGLFNLLSQEYGIDKRLVSLSKRKQLLCEQGDEKVYYLIRGVVSFERKEDILYLVGKNHFIGLESLFFYPTDDLEAKSVGAVEAWEFQKADIISFLMSMQEGWIYGYLISQISRNKLIDVLEKGNCRSSEKHRKMLISLANEFGQRRNGSLIIPEEFTYKILKSYLGIHSHVAIKKVIKEISEFNVEVGCSLESDPTQ